MIIIYYNVDLILTSEKKLQKQWKRNDFETSVFLYFLKAIIFLRIVFSKLEIYFSRNFCIKF